MSEFPPKSKTEDLSDGRRLGESEEDFQARKNAEAEAKAKKEAEKAEAEERERHEAEAAREAAGRLTHPVLVAEKLKDDGGQTRIDLGAYHSWLDSHVEPTLDVIVDSFSEEDRKTYDGYMADKFADVRGEDPKARRERLRGIDAARQGLIEQQRLRLMSQPAYERMSADDAEAVLRAESAIRAFNGSAYTDEQRRQFLQTGKVEALFSDTTSEEEKKATAAEIDFLRQEGFFQPKAKGSEALVIDPDFRSKEIGGETGVTIDARLDTAERWFSEKSVAEQRQLLWDARTDEEKLESVPADMRETYATGAARVAEIRDGWYEGLSDEDKEQGIARLRSAMEAKIKADGLDDEAAEKRRKILEGIIGDEEECKRALWSQSGPDRLKDIPEELQAVYLRADNTLYNAKKAWFNGLTTQERTRRTTECIADQRAAVLAWNGIPAEQRRAFLETGDFGALAKKKEGEEDKAGPFDIGSPEGRKIIETLTRLDDMGVMQFGEERTPMSREEADAWRQAHADRIDEIAARDEADSSREGLRDAIHDEVRAEAWEKYYQQKIAEGRSEKFARKEADNAVDRGRRARGIDTETDRRLAEEEAAAAARAEKIEGDDRKIELLKKHRATELAQMIKEKPELFSEDKDAAMEEAAYLLAAKGDPNEFEYQTKMLEMRRRHEKEEASKKGEGEFKGVKYTYRGAQGEDGVAQGEGGVDTLGHTYRIISEDGTEVVGLAMTREEAEKKAAEVGGTVFEETLHDIDYLNGDDDEILDKMRVYYPRRPDEKSVEEYHERLRKILDQIRAGAEQADAKSKDEKAREDARRWLDDKDFAAFVAGKEKAEKDAKRQELADSLGIPLEEVSEEQLGGGLRDRMLSSMTAEELSALRDEYGKDTPAGRRDALYDRLRGHETADRIAALLGKDPENGKSIAEMSDDEVSALLSEIDQALNTSDRFVARMQEGVDDGFRRFVLSKYPGLADMATQMNLRKDAVDKLVGDYEKMMTGDVAAVSTDMRGDADRIAREIAGRLFELDMDPNGNSTKFGRFVRGKLLRKHTQKSYLEKARRFIESDGRDRSGKIWKRVTNPNELLNGYWKNREATSVFEDVIRGTEGVSLLAGEKMTTYGIRAGDDGAKIVYRIEGGRKTDLAEGDPMIATTLGLESAYETYAQSSGDAAAKEAFRAKIEELGLSGDNMRADNFMSQAESIREAVFFGRSVESIEQGFKLSMAEGGRSNARVAAIRAMQERRAENLPKPEKVPHVRRATFDAIYATLYDAMQSVREAGDGPDKDSAMTNLHEIMARAELQRRHELIRWGKNSDDEQSRYDKAIDDAYGLLGGRDDEHFGNAALDELVGSLERGEVAGDLAGVDYKIELSDQRIRELSGGDTTRLESAINAWNNRNVSQQQAMMMSGQGLVGGDYSTEMLYLRDLGLIDVVASDERISTEILGRPLKEADGHDKIPVRTGITAESLSTSIDVSDATVEIAIRESQSEHSVDEIKNALSVWNGASSAERRAYLMGISGSAVSEGLRGAGDVLKGVFIDREPSFAKTAVLGYGDRDISTILDLVNPVLFGERGVTVQDIKRDKRIWASASVADRLKYLRGEYLADDGSVRSDAGLSAEFLQAADDLDGVGLIDESMAEDTENNNRFGRALNGLKIWRGLSQDLRQRAVEGGLVFDESSRTGTRSLDREHEAFEALRDLGLSEEQIMAL